MELLFLGTSAGVPTPERNMSALALKKGFGKEWFLFDCGEGTQLTLKKTTLSIAALSHIFITHFHGDHFFGLPGLLSSRSLAGIDSPLTIHAPRGIKTYLTVVMQTAQLNLGYALKLHEVEDAGEVFAIDGFQVHAVPMKHTMSTFGFVLEETKKPGRLDAEKLKNMGISEGAVYGRLKNGEDVMLEDGTMLLAKAFLLPPLPSKKIAIAGDNADPSVFEPYVKEADILVHEATYTEETFEKLNRAYLHSTAKMVAETAESCKVKRLVLTHFSPRYTLGNGNENLEDIRVEAEHYYRGEVVLAEDLMQITL